MANIMRHTKHVIMSQKKKKRMLQKIPIRNKKNN